MKKILLLDDNDEYFEILELVLGKRYIIRSSIDTKYLTQLMIEFKPDLVIVDHFLGIYASPVILNSLRSTASGRYIPFILFSGVYDIEKRAIELGAIGYISKPSSVDYIRKYVDDYFKYRNHDQ